MGKISSKEKVMGLSGLTDSKKWAKYRIKLKISQGYTFKQCERKYRPWPALLKNNDGDGHIHI